MRWEPLGHGLTGMIYHGIQYKGTIGPELSSKATPSASLNEPELKSSSKPESAKPEKFSAPVFRSKRPSNVESAVVSVRNK